jgi:hypothetical protein
MQNTVTPQANLATPATSAALAQPNSQAQVSVTLPQGVVLNDTPTAAQAVQGSQATASALEQLVTEREVWEQAAFRTSNEQLYALLQRCYGLYKAMEGGSAQAAALRSGLKDYINLKGLSTHFNKGSHTLTKIVKCVFGSDRRRVNAYSIVLRSALARGVGLMDVAEFIRSEGGVEEIRLAKSPNATTPKQKAAVATTTVVVNSIGVVSSPALSGLLNDAGKIGTNMVLIGTWQSDGSVLVRAVVESEAVLTAALASHYSTIKQAAIAQSQEQKQVDVAAAKQMAIDAAVATASVTA